MKRVCAWCGQELEQTERLEGMQVTHGVCQACRHQFFASPKAKDADSAPTLGDGSNNANKAGEHVPGGPTTLSDEP